jgi:hypothetical protein
LLIGEDVKPPRLVQTQGLDPVVNRKVLILHLVQHHRQHDDVVNCRILQQIDLRETPSPLRVLKPKPGGAKQERDKEEWPGYLVEQDVGVNNEDGSGIGAELAVGGGGGAGGAGGGAAVDVVAEVVLPDDLWGRDGRG